MAASRSHLLNCRMQSAYMPEALQQREASRILAASAEAVRLASLCSGAPAAPAHATQASAHERADARRSLGMVTPGTYNPRNPRGICFSHRVGAVLEAEARRRCLTHPVWYSATEAKEVGLVPVEAGVSVVLGMELLLRPLAAFLDSDARALLQEVKLPTSKTKRDHTFTAEFDGRPYERPQYLFHEKWKQTNSKHINSALVRRRLHFGLPNDLWVHASDVARFQLALHPNVVAATLSVDLAAEPAKPQETSGPSDATFDQSEGAAYAAVRVCDGTTETLYCRQMLESA
jgi:hypothetical protein